MTSPSVPVTARTPVSGWLLPASRDARIKLERVVMQVDANDNHRARPLQKLGAVPRRALITEIEAKLRMVIDETLADILLGGWSTYLPVTQAIRKSRGQPGVDQVVPLSKHTIKTDHRHNLDIEVDTFPVMTLPVHLGMRVEPHDAVAVVRDGELVAVRSGQAKADGTVSVNGVKLAQRTLTIPLAGELALRRSSR